MSEESVSGLFRDAESLASGQTNKKDDTKGNGSSAHYRIDLIKQLCVKYVLIPVTIIFAIIGFISVTFGINTTQPADESLTSFGGGDLPLASNNPGNMFDGHISLQQTRSIGKFSKLIGVEPYGGPKTIEKLMENVVDLTEPFSRDDIPFYWEVGGSGFDVGQELCKCLNITIASTYGNDEAGNPAILDPIATEGNFCKIYNVNLGTHEGVSRAKRNGIISQVEPDFITSPMLPEVISMFSPEKKARIVMAAPNTNFRVGQSYNYLKQKGLFEGSFLDFVSSNHVLANNYLTHLLSGKWGGVQKLTEEDLITAAEILKKKFIVVRFADHRKMNKYLIEQKGWDPNGYECMYPPENPWSQQAADAPRPPPPPKSADEIATEKAIQSHNNWDNRLFDILNHQGAEQLGSIV